MRGIERGKCTCGECEDFVRSDRATCGHCGCLPTRHSKKDTHYSSDSIGGTKPPKTENRGNERTHHYRKQVHLAKEEFFSGGNANGSLCTSMDDEAYLRPETSKGAKGA